MDIYVEYRKEAENCGIYSSAQSDYRIATEEASILKIGSILLDNVVFDGE